MSGGLCAPGIVALFGATGTGKTGLACEIADRIPCHLISCDALSVYRGLDAATAKPRGDEARHAWALVDVAEPTTDVNLGAWVRAAETEVAWAWHSGRVPLVVGGTGLYLRGLLKGVAPAPPRDATLRARLAGRAAERGVPYLHRVLARLDPRTAARLRPTDPQRVIRALEVRLLTGDSLAELQGEGWRGPDRWPVLRFGLEVPREELYPRLDARVDGFFARGLVAEVRWLLGPGGVPAGSNALSGIGYREVAAAVATGPAAPAPRNAAGLVEAVRLSTRHYAKRQETWFRREIPAERHDPREPGLADRLAARIAAWCREG